MRKMGKTTEIGSKVFHLNYKDIELIVSLLHEECDQDIYHDDKVNLKHGKLTKKFLKETYDHCQDLIMELTK